MSNLYDAFNKRINLHYNLIDFYKNQMYFTVVDYKFGVIDKC
jgi:hypothetical protein